MKKICFIAIIFSFFCIEAVEAKETLLCQYDYSVKINYASLEEYANETLEDWGEMASSCDEAFDGLFQKGFFSKAGKCIKNGASAVGGTLGGNVVTDAVNDSGDKGKVPVKIQVFVDGTTLLNGEKPKVILKYSDACDGQTRSCSKTHINEGYEGEGFGNANEVAIVTDTFWDITKKGVCPSEAYIELWNLMEWTPGKNEVCFGNDKTCHKATGKYFVGSYATIGYNIKTLDDQIVKNKLDEYAEEITKEYEARIQEKYNAPNSCSTIIDTYIAKFPDDINAAKDAASKDISADVKKIYEAAYVTKYPDTGQVIWDLIEKRIDYLNSTDATFRDPVDMSNDCWDNLLSQCIEGVDSDPNLTPEEKAEKKGQYGIIVSAIKSEVGQVLEESIRTYIWQDFSGNDCEGFLGDPSANNTPAYYLQLSMNIIKYLGIILTFVFSIIDFTKAITSQDKDLIQKAAKSSIKRLVYAIIIFFLPIIINFILSLVGAYSTCVS